jgi:hypothetical protein
MPVVDVRHIKDEAVRVAIYELSISGISTTQVQFATPLTGGTVIVEAATGIMSRLVLTPAGTLATLTISLASISPLDGHVLEVSTTQQITELTINGETFLLNANSGASWIYKASNTTWYARY